MTHTPRPGDRERPGAGHTSSPGDRERPGARPAPAGAVVIDCDRCAVRGTGCHDCVVSVLLGAPQDLLDDERAALDVLADAGMAPRLRLVPIDRHRSGVA